MNPYKDKNLRQFIESIPKDEIERQNRLQIEETAKLHEQFIAGLKVGKCFLCNQSMNSFNESTPCFHWFTYPTGIRKKHFENYLKTPLHFFRLDSYLRWLANSEVAFKNINDLKDEISSTSQIETTIKYKNIEWAFSIGHTDIAGHLNSKVGATPHYHIQMKVDNRVFLKFNKHHIPFSDEDLFNLSLMEQAGDLVQFEQSFGTGISVLEDESNLEIIDNATKVTDDFENATINRQTFIEAPKGQTFSGKLLQDAIEESKRTGEPIGKIMQRLVTNAKVTTVISPGDGVAKMTKRTGKK
ncbi:MAG: hypothetical protein ACK5Z2_00910 [Bacteroidota bacterium]|jgi:hypothetical protein